MNFNNQNNNTNNNTQPIAIGGAQGQYAPFGVPGNYSYETRMNPTDGITYIWNAMQSGMWEDSNDVGSGNPMAGGYGFGGITF